MYHGKHSRSRTFGEEFAETFPILHDLLLGAGFGMILLALMFIGFFVVV